MYIAGGIFTVRAFAILSGLHVELFNFTISLQYRYCIIQQPASFPERQMY